MGGTSYKKFPHKILLIKNNRDDTGYNRLHENAISVGIFEIGIDPQGVGIVKGEQVGIVARGIVLARGEVKCLRGLPFLACGVGRCTDAHIGATVGSDRNAAIERDHLREHADIVKLFDNTPRLAIVCRTRPIAGLAITAAAHQNKKRTVGHYVKARLAKSLGELKTTAKRCELRKEIPSASVILRREDVGGIILVMSVYGIFACRRMELKP